MSDWVNVRVSRSDIRNFCIMRTREREGVGKTLDEEKMTTVIGCKSFMTDGAKVSCCC